MTSPRGNVSVLTCVVITTDYPKYKFYYFLFLKIHETTYCRSTKHNHILSSRMGDLYAYISKTTMTSADAVESVDQQRHVEKHLFFFKYMMNII